MKINWTECFGRLWIMVNYTNVFLSSHRYFLAAGSNLVRLVHRVGRVLRFFSSRRNWDSPNPSPAGECAPPLVPGGRGTLAGERGVGESQFRRGDIHCGTLYIHVLCGLVSNSYYAVLQNKLPPKVGFLASFGRRQLITICPSANYNPD